ncbi:MAG: preprotein translocase subunit SecE [Firmicutes bacterium]|nr:preprotein translocase subunit SecE [Bacillota bacterium]
MANIKRVEAGRFSEYRTRTTNFLRTVWSELKKVHWPNRSELITYTGVVLISVAFVALLIWLVDSVLSFLLEQLFKALA